MALITLPKDLKDLDFANVEDLMDDLDTIVNEMNGFLDDANVKAGADIDPGKIAGGGAVTQSEVTSTGEVSKIPKLDGSGDLVANRIIFLTGDL